MDKVLLKDLRKQNKYTQFFQEWKEQEFQAHPEEQKKMDELEQLSQNIGMREGMTIACFDYRNLSLAFFTGNVEELTGYPESMFRAKGMETSFALIHPEDRPELFRFQKIVFDSFHLRTMEEKHTFEFSYTTRWVHRKTNVIIWMLGKVRPYLIDAAGNFAMDLHIIMQLHTPPQTTGYDWNYSYQKENGTRIFVSKNSPNSRVVSLTKKEKEIVKLILEGKESKEIAENLNISINTVGTHRKNILKKLKARNVGEMVKILSMYHF
ncbi:LuxR C-terminal-related transcriptional regulator [Algoriphagus persicinus]|uniref:LuxR C-terminal-related transcriptional regulator n=1 Tax=Algoriphagus persicinus TaxID=3108754 RepID=UPI002B3882D3|nr:LuxR C-terminal-related transcriptional regulator [Algoriphagus sp. E1-3-M2]MEB2783387.1 LuxR C-terminal-related transcriptional regulator [Algoriphagus sp. E1-3-M2]